MPWFRTVFGLPSESGNRSAAVRAVISFNDT
jgi:hypothetical protein